MCINFITMTKLKLNYITSIKYILLLCMTKAVPNKYLYTCGVDTYSIKFSTKYI